MKYELSCRDLGMNDNFIARGNKKRDVLKKMIVHAKREHNMRDNQINSPKMRKLLRERVHPAY